jgi:hypothetical protein
MPAVMNNMCAPSMALRMCVFGHLGGFAPLSGLLPAPRPVLPSWMVRWASLVAQCLRIGIGADELHPCTALAIMWATALPPPPPTPITLIWVPWLKASSSMSSMAMVLSWGFNGWVKKVM